MNNQKGFIATSLIYSFFLLLTVLLLGYVTIYLHDKILLDKVTNDIKEDIYTQGKVTLADKVEIGSYLTIPLKSSLTSTNNLRWIVIKKNIDNLKLITDYMLYATSSYKDLELLDNEYKQFIGLNNKSINYLNKSDITYLESLVIKDKVLNITPKYLYLDNGSIYSYNYNCETISNCSITKDIVDLNITPNEILASRGIITINNKLVVKSGNGTVSNPYTFNHLKLDNLIFYLDARNNMGYSSNINDKNILDLSGTYKTPITANINIENQYIDLSVNLITSYNLEQMINSDDGFTFQFYLEDNLDVKISFNGNSIIVNKNKVEINSSSLPISNVSKITIIKNNNNLRVYTDSKYEGNITNNIIKRNDDKLKISGNKLKGLLIYSKALTDLEIYNNQNLWTGEY